MRMHLERLHQLMAQNVSDSPGYMATERIGFTRLHGDGTYRIHPRLHGDGTYRIHPVTLRRNVPDSPGYTATEHIGFTRGYTAMERIGSLISKIGLD